MEILKRFNFYENLHHIVFLNHLIQLLIHKNQLLIKLHLKVLYYILLVFDLKIFKFVIQFIKKENEFYRQNEIWRDTISKKTGNTVSTELMVKNFARVTYTPEVFLEK